MKRILILVLVSLLMLLAACESNEAKGEESSGHTSFPEKPVQLVIPYPPGGGTDVLFRLVASYAEEHLGQPIVPQNMGGATATVGSREVKDAEPDGYTILGSHQVIATANHTGIVDYGFEAFEPVMLMTSTPHILSISKEFSEEHGITTVTEFTEYVEQHPGEVTWAFTTGSEDHYTVAAMLDAAGVDPKSLNYVNYDGTGPQYAALVANQVMGMTADYASGAGYFEDGSLIPLAMVDEERNPYLPNVPTLIEQGIDFAVTVDRGVFAPKGTPPEVVEVLNQAFADALAEPELQEEIEELGSFENYTSTDEYRLHLEELDEKMAELSDKMIFD
ncbi:tripartite tricarboxylate transporter substrate binding protein [Gracilibacillus sp. HCP3S3_G5_1]|uniref:tripartite tricarboxylate transporter substrate binding protein n=1 Tax=unclassified Gracilibacillus TaxID=2625209 RepID=UPI003F8964A4